MGQIRKLLVEGGDLRHGSPAGVTPARRRQIADRRVRHPASEPAATGQLERQRFLVHDGGAVGALDGQIVQRQRRERTAFQPGDLAGHQIRPVLEQLGAAGSPLGERPVILGQALAQLSLPLGRALLVNQGRGQRGVEGEPGSSIGVAHRRGRAKCAHQAGQPFGDPGQVTQDDGCRQLRWVIAGPDLPLPVGPGERRRLIAHGGRGLQLQDHLAVDQRRGLQLEQPAKAHDLEGRRALGIDARQLHAGMKHQRYRGSQGKTGHLEVTAGQRQRGGALE